MANFYPEAYGALADGSDDTVALQCCISAAAQQQGTVVLPAGKIYSTSARLLVPNGLRGFTGPGGLRALGSTQQSYDFGLYLKGIHHENQAQYPTNVNVKDLVIDGVHFDCSDIASACVEAENSSRITVINCTIVNVKVGLTCIRFTAHRDGGEDSTNIYVKNNSISFGLNDLSGGGIGVGGDSQTVADEHVDVYWRNYHKPKPAAHWAKSCEISGNQVTGSEYGISIGVMDGCKVSGNTVTHTARAVVAQNDCRNIDIIDNTMNNTAKTAVHIAYGADTVNVIGNYASTNRSIGHAMYQAYIGMREVHLVNNVAITTGGVQENLFYIGVMANNCSIIDNFGSGLVSRSCIGVDSAFLDANYTKDNVTYTRPNENLSAGNWMAGTPKNDNGTPVPNGSGHTDTITIRGNVLEPGGSQPAIFLGQITDHLGEWEIRNVRISDNRVRNTTAQYYLKLDERTSGSFKPVSYTYNYWIEGATTAKLSVGNVAFKQRWGNAEDTRPTVGTVVGAEPCMRLIRTGTEMENLSGFVSANVVSSAQDPEVSFRWRTGWDCGAGFNDAPTTGHLPDTKYLVRVNEAGEVLLHINGGLYGSIANPATNGDKVTVRYVRATGALQVTVGGVVAPPVALGGGALNGNISLDATVFTGAIDLLYFGASGGTGTAFPQIKRLSYLADTLSLVPAPGTTGWETPGMVTGNTVPAGVDPEVALRWEGGSAVLVGFNDAIPKTDGRYQNTRYALSIDTNGNMYFNVNGGFFSGLSPAIPAGSIVRMRYIRSTGKIEVRVGDVNADNTPIVIGGGTMPGAIYLEGAAIAGALQVEYFGPRQTT